MLQYIIDIWGSIINPLFVSYFLPVLSMVIIVTIPCIIRYIFSLRSY